MAAVLQTFRQYLICQDRRGGTVELWRSETEAVCLAVDPARQVFVELHAGTEPPERQREEKAFRQAVRAAALVRGKNVAGVIEGGREDGANFFIADFLDGERLETWLERCAPLPPWLALQTVLQAAQGLCELAEHPLLLAGVELFHACLMLNGPRPQDLCLKLCDAGLVSTPGNADPQQAEARAIQQAGRLLLRMLTGQITDESGGRGALESLDAAPETRLLLDRILQPSLPEHPDTVEQLREMLSQHLNELPPEQSERPDRLPAAWRPRLPLAAHFAPPEAVAEALNAKFSVDARPFDAAEPYRCRAAERASRQRVVVQMLPPEHLFPPGQVTPPVAEIAARLAQAPEGVHLLRLHRLEDITDSELLVEEWPGTWTLERLINARHALRTEEILLILKQFDAAALEAEALGLPLHWQNPRQIAVRFSGGEEEVPRPLRRARLPLTEWPEFRLKFRAWPVTLNFTQPESFLVEHLLWKDGAAAPFALPAQAGPPPGSGKSPGGRDLAVLAAWMSGGSGHLPEMLMPLLHDPLDHRAGFSNAEVRRDFLQRFAQNMNLQAAVPRRPSLWLPAQAQVIEAEPKSRPKMRDRMNRLKKRLSKPDLRRPPVIDLPHENFTVEPSDKIKSGREDQSAPAMGFAEALFNNREFADDGPSLFGAGPEDSGGETTFFSRDSARQLPPPAEGFLFEQRHQAESGAESERPFLEMNGDFEDSGYLPEKAGSGKLMLFLVVVLIAAAVAALLAHLSGMALWQN